MNRRLVLSTFVVSALLSSCTNNYLRSDIKEFIASFSLEDSVSAYKHAGYTKTQTVYQDNKITKTVENMAFNVTDASHPEYRKTIETFEDNEKKEEQTEYVIEENNEFTFVAMDGSHIEYTLLQVHELVEKFFYTSVQAEVVHLYGMYYGDYIRQIAVAAQQWVTIDQENELYVYEVSDKFTNNTGDEVREYQKYSINKLGMLVNNFLSRETDYLKVVTEIETYNYL